MARSDSVDVFLRLHGQRKFSKELATSATQLEAMGVKGAKSIASFAATSEKLKGFGRSWTRNVSLPMTIGAVLAGKAAIDWESAFAGVRKTVDATEKQYASMETGLRKMALEVPVAATELAGIAEAAGQLGIKRSAILGFTRTIADMGVATNLAGEEGASTLARFANITQMPQSQFRRLGSTIVALGNAGASTEKDIAAMGLRLAAAGTFAGMSESNVLAIANALSSVGIEAEAGGTAMSKVIKTINSQVIGQLPALGEFAEIAGMGADQFSRSWKRDAAGTLTGWIEGLGKLKNEGKDVAGTLSDLHVSLRGERVQDTLSRAAGAGSLLRESLDLGTKSWRENNALTKEAEQRYKTVASQLQILKNKVIDAGIGLGKELLPPLIDLVNFVGPQLAVLADGFGALPGPVKATALGLLILTGPVASGLGYFASGAGKALVLMAKLSTAGRGFSAAMSIFGTARAAGQGFGGSASMALQGTGVAAAGSVAKGFALSLGPAIAALGVANIVMSATEGDWKATGFEAGYAVAGGVLGMVGGPMGAMIGAGLGSMLGRAMSDVFDTGTKLTLRQMKLARSAKEVARYFKEQRVAGTGLAASTRKVEGAQAKAEATSRAIKTAERQLTTTKHNSRRGSDAVAMAEWRVTRAKDANREASKKLKNANREHGASLRWFKQIARGNELEARNRVNNLRKQLDGIKALDQKERARGAGETRLTEIAKRGTAVKDALSKAERKHKESLIEVANKAGPKWAQWLSHARRETIEFGSVLKEVESKAEGLMGMTDRFLNNGSEPLVPANPFTPKAPTQPTPSGSSPGRRGGGGGVPGGVRNKPKAGASSRPLSGFGGADTIIVQSVLDGQVIAENVVKRTNREAARK